MARIRTAVIAATIICVMAIPILSRNAGAIKGPDTIKVGLMTGQKSVSAEVSAGTYTLEDGQGDTVIAGLEPGQPIVAQVDAERQMSITYAEQGTQVSLQVAGNTLSLIPSGGECPLFKVAGHRYRGSLLLTVAPSGTITVVNELPLEEYLFGVVGREMSKDWPIEALKAQAVAARTYAVKNLSKHLFEGFNLCATTNCQVYGGFDSESASIIEAVNSTCGQVLVDDKGVLIYAMFHSNSGGYTESAANTFSGDFSYLKSKPDPYSLGYGLADWSYVASSDGTDSQGRQGMKQLLSGRFPGIGRVSQISLVKYPSGRVQEVIITDEFGKEYELSGNEFGQLFNPGFSTYVSKNNVMSRFFDLKSDVLFSVMGAGGAVDNRDGGLDRLSVVGNGTGSMTLGETEEPVVIMGASGSRELPVYPTAYTFTGHGWGHGVGMSQWGAYGMAVKDFKYTDILSFYYEGARIVNLE